RVLLDGGGWITAITSGVGNAGTVRVNAQSLELTGGSVDDLPGVIATQVNAGSSGNGGDLVLNVDRLQVSDGAQIATSTFGAGDAGRLQIFAQDIEVTGATSQSPSGLFSSVIQGATGKGGNLEITTGRLRVADGAQVAADTLGDGNAGNLIVKAQTVELTGFGQQGKSGLFAGAIIGSGAGGDISVKADQLTIRNGATISVSNFASRDPSIPAGQGPAGNAQIDARYIQLDNHSTLTAASAGGDKGNIFLNSEVLELRHGSSISTNALGNATGGNISIKTDFLVAVKDENSDITANAVNNFGGRVIIEARGIFGIEYRSQLTPFSDITASSALGPLFSGTVEIRTPDTDPTRGLTQFPSELVDASNRIAAACERSQGNTFVVTGRGGLPEDASQPLRGGSVWSDLRLSALPTQNGPSAVAPVPKSVSQPSVAAPIVEAQGWVTDANGQITLVGQVPHQPGVGTWDKPVDCRQFTSTITDRNGNSPMPGPQVSSAGSVK
ncbi:MAG: S-layer family protein, partial [Kovacikia sp.]